MRHEERLKVSNIFHCLYICLCPGLFYYTFKGGDHKHLSSSNATCRSRFPKVIYFIIDHQIIVICWSWWSYDNHHNLMITTFSKVQTSKSLRTSTSSLDTVSAPSKWDMLIFKDLLTLPWQELNLINFNIVKEKLLRPDEDKNGCCLYFHYITVFFVNFGGSQIVNQKHATKKPPPQRNIFSVTKYMSFGTTW